MMTVHPNHSITHTLGHMLWIKCLFAECQEELSIDVMSSYGIVISQKNQFTKCYGKQ